MKFRIKIDWASRGRALVRLDQPPPPPQPALVAPRPRAIRVPIVLQDRAVAGAAALPETSCVVVRADAPRDGLATEHLRVELGGGAALPLRFIRRSERQPGHYEIPPSAAAALDHPVRIALSAFGTVLSVVDLFESPDVLGRRLHWAFDDPQLLLQPCAGRGRNAYYDRRAGALRFLSFDADDGTTVHTALSHDIVVHETAHAVLDAVAPDLYDAVTPESHALHEAFADMTALIAALHHQPLRHAAIGASGGAAAALEGGFFSALAEEFGRAIRRRRADSLRNLYNARTLDPQDRSVDAAGRPNFVDVSEPHALSEILSGALYRFLIQLHRDVNAPAADPGADRPSSEALDRSLAAAARQFKRFVFRALDFLPPGDVGFVDFARAVIAADLAVHDGHRWEGGALRALLCDRHVARDPGAFALPDALPHDRLAGVDLERLVGDDRVAHAFAARNLDVLGVPADTPFDVQPRLRVRKKYTLPTFDRPGGRVIGYRTEWIEECIFKVAWTDFEPLAIDSLPSRRAVRSGTTLVIGWRDRKVRALLTPTRDQGPLREQRDAFLRRLLDRGLLGSGGGLDVDDAGGVLRVRGAGRSLHVVGPTEAP